MVETLIMRLTFIPTKTAKKIIADHNKNPSAKLGQNTLAENVVTFLRGKEEYLKAKKISDALFSGNVVNLSNDELFTALSGTRVFNATKSSYNIVDLLVEAKVCNSKTEGRQLISQKNIVYNNIVVETNDKVVDNKFSFTSKKTKFSFIKKGKKD
jgi:tyrosyl-tRNA synthetase